MSDEECGRRVVILPEREKVKKRRSRIFKDFPCDEADDPKITTSSPNKSFEQITGKKTPTLRSQEEILEDLRRLLPSFSCEINNCESEFKTQASSLQSKVDQNYEFAIEAFTVKDMNPEIPQLIFSLTLSSLQDDEEKRPENQEMSIAKISSFSDCLQTKIKISGSHEINRLSSLRKRYLIN